MGAIMKIQSSIAKGTGSLIAFIVTTCLILNTGTSQVLIEIEYHPTFGSPFDIESIGDDCYPQLVDFDGDQDVDIVFGNDLGDIYRLENIGTSTEPLFADPIEFLPTGDLTHAKPRFVDIDNDGDLDVFIGSDEGKVHFYRRQSFGYLYEGFNLFQINPGDGHCSPAFGDIDLDGDYDLFIGTEDALLFARNLGTKNVPSYGPVESNPFSFNPSSKTRLTIELADYNTDGKLDLLMGYLAGGVFIYFNEGSSNFPSFGSITIAPVVSGNNQSAPAVGDIDNDGDLDLILARNIVGPLPNFHVYMGSNAPPSFELNTDHPFFGDSIWGGNVAVDFGDYNSDGDLDLVIGNAAGEVNIAENVGSITDFQFDETQVLPYGLLLGETQATPQWADLNRDNTLDLYVGGAVGNIWEYENVGGIGNPSFIFRGINTDGYVPQNNLSAPTFGAIDGGAEQMLCGGADGRFYFFKNSESFPDLTWEFIDVNPFGLTDIGFTSAPKIIDIDGDRDRDIITGSLDGNIYFFENSGSFAQPQFEERILNPFGITNEGLVSKPTLGDIDADGDYDLLVGYTNGRISFFENRPCVSTLKLNHIDRNQQLYQSDSTIITKALFRNGTNNSVRAHDAVECEFGFEVSAGATLQVDMGRCINN